MRYLTGNPERLLLCAGLLLAGCAASGLIGQQPNLSYEDQQREIRKLVPAGTPREVAAQRLIEAGIEFSPSGEGAITWSAGMNSAVFYCRRWRKPDGTDLLLDVAVLFDERGEVFETRPADASTGPETGSSVTPATASRSTANDIFGVRRAAGNSQPEPDDTSTRGGPRSAFGR